MTGKPIVPPAGAQDVKASGDEIETIGGRPLARRTFVKILGAGLLISASPAVAQDRRRSGRGPSVAARLHIGKDGAIVVMTGKVELGQGARAEITQAAAEELRVAPARIELIMADTELCPDDGITAGSRTTPQTIPAVRSACAFARELLAELAAKRWGVDRGAVRVRDGAVVERAVIEGAANEGAANEGAASEGAASGGAASGGAANEGAASEGAASGGAGAAGALPDGAAARTITYAELAGAVEETKAFERSVPGDVSVTPVAEWKVLGTGFPRPNIRDLATGAHRFPSDVVRPGMLRGKVLRPPSYGAKLASLDPSRAKAMDGVVVVRDGDLVGCAAPTTHRAGEALRALAEAAVWDAAPHPSSGEIFGYLKAHARGGGRGGQAGPGGQGRSVADALRRAERTLSATYTTAYIQHAPMETRAAVAEWDGDKLTVWTGSQNPFGIRSELQRAFGLPPERARVIIPDAGGGFGGKHTGECAVEAARLARGAGRPVALQWTREEEFTWAYYRPAALIEIEAGLDAKGALVAWGFTNFNSGGAAIATPYRVPAARTEYVPCDAPMRQGSYRTLAATANNFARECFMDELAAAAGSAPLPFRLAHLDEPRLRAVLEAAARRFDWEGRARRKGPGVGIGLACGTEKGSFVAACAEVHVDAAEGADPDGAISVRHVCQVFECGKVIDPPNLLSQVQGCMIMGLGGAIFEEMEFEGGKMLTDRFSRYRVPRFSDVPPLDIELLDRPDLPSVGGGETPIIVIAPAIANAVFDATGVRLRSLPLGLPAGKGD